MGWFTRKKQAGPEKDERYNGKPLLIVLEGYVLSVIGELSAQKETELIAILQQLYGGREINWRTVLRTRFQIANSMDETLRQMWIGEQERAEQEKTPLVPEEFARNIVDQNFAHLVN